MRIGYYSGDDWTLIESKYQYIMSEDGELLTMAAIESEYVINPSGDSNWDADHFFWYVDEAGEWAGPYLLTDSQIEADNYDNIVEVEYTEVDVTGIKEDYLEFYFQSHETDYQVLLAASKETHLGTYENNYSEGQGPGGTGEEIYYGNSDGIENADAGTDDYSGSGESTTSSSKEMTLHLMVVANTSISDIGPSTKVDVNNIISEFNGISGVLGVKLNKKVISEDLFTKTNVDNYLKAFNPSPNDVVIFLYSGHGYRFSDQTNAYPQMDLRSNEYQSISPETTLNLSEIYDRIVAKGARLNIILGDCCNSDIGFSRSVGTGFLASRSTVNADPSKLASLFLHAEGDIIAAGATKGEYSWCSMNVGGFFTSSFIGALREEVSKFRPDDKPRWQDILASTKKGTKKKSEMCTGCQEQNAIYYQKME